MVVNWAQRQLVSMKAPVLFWQKQEKKSSLEKAALCREANRAELLPCSLAVIDQRFSCCATPTTAHILPVSSPKNEYKGKKVKPAQHFPRYILFFSVLFWCEWMFAKVCNSMQTATQHTCPFHSFLISIWATIFGYWLPSEAIIAAAYSITGDVL